MARRRSGSAMVASARSLPMASGLFRSMGSPAKLVLLPTGVGEPKQLTDNKTDHFNVALAARQQIDHLQLRAEPATAHAPISRCRRQAAPRVLTPEGTPGSCVSPDGQFVLAPMPNESAGSTRSQAEILRKSASSLECQTKAPGISPDDKSLFVRTATIPSDYSHRHRDRKTRALERNCSCRSRRSAKHCGASF